MAPKKRREVIDFGFQMAVMISILLSNFINFITVKIDGGCSWRVSLGLVAFPPMFMMAGTLALSNTPSSLIERGHTDAAKRTLQKVHGSLNVEQEFQDLLYASYFLNRIEYPWKHILLPRYRPQLVICILVPMFQRLTGINAITFYAPVLLRSQEFGSDCSPKAGVITGTVNILASFVVIISVHRFGRRVLFLAGGMLMMVCQVKLSLHRSRSKLVSLSHRVFTKLPNLWFSLLVFPSFQIGIGAIIALQFGFTGEGSLTKTEGHLMLILICSYASYGLGVLWDG